MFGSRWAEKRYVNLTAFRCSGGTRTRRITSPYPHTVHFTSRRRGNSRWRRVSPAWVLRIRWAKSSRHDITNSAQQTPQNVVRQFSVSTHRIFPTQAETILPAPTKKKRPLRCMAQNVAESTWQTRPLVHALDTLVNETVRQGDGAGGPPSKSRLDQLGGEMPGGGLIAAADCPRNHGTGNRHSRAGWQVLLRTGRPPRRRRLSSWL